MYKYIHTNIIDTTGKGERHDYWGGVNVAFCMELRRCAQGAPGLAYPWTAEWNTGVQDHFYKIYQDLTVHFVVGLQWNFGSSFHGHKDCASNNNSAGAHHHGSPPPKES